MRVRGVRAGPELPAVRLRLLRSAGGPVPRSRPVLIGLRKRARQRARARFGIGISWLPVIGQLPALLALLVVGAGDAPAGGTAAPAPAAPNLPGPTVTPMAPPAPTPDELPIAISWNAPDECPGIDAVKSEVRRVAGKVPPPAEPLSADVTIRRGAGAGWLLTLATRAGTRAGERRLRGLRLRGADARRRAGPRADDQSAGLLRRRAAAAAATATAPAAAARARTPLRGRRRRDRRQRRASRFRAAASACGSPRARRRCPPSCVAASGRRAAPRAPMIRPPAGRSTSSTVPPRAARAPAAIDACRRACAPARRWCACTDRGYGVGYPARRSPPGGPPRSPRRTCACGSRRSTPCGWRHRWWSRWAARISSLPGWVMYSNPQRFGYVEHWVGSYTFDPWARVPPAIHRRW